MPIAIRYCAGDSKAVLALTFNFSRIIVAGINAYTPWGLPPSVVFPRKKWYNRTAQTRFTYTEQLTMIEDEISDRTHKIGSYLRQALDAWTRLQNHLPYVDRNGSSRDYIDQQLIEIGKAVLKAAETNAGIMSAFPPIGIFEDYVRWLEKNPNSLLLPPAKRT